MNEYEKDCWVWDTGKVESSYSMTYARTFEKTFVDLLEVHERCPEFCTDAVIIQLDYYNRPVRVMTLKEVFRIRKLKQL
jgi:hypothetical protein